MNTKNAKKNLLIKIEKDLERLFPFLVFQSEKEDFLKNFIANVEENFSDETFIKKIVENEISFPKISIFDEEKIPEVSLLFIDGYLSLEHCKNLPENIQVKKVKETPKSFIMNKMKKSVFSSYHDLFCQEAIEIVFKKNLKKPFPIFFCFTKAVEKCSVFPKIFFRLEKGAEVQVKLVSQFLKNVPFTFFLSLQASLEHQSKMECQSHFQLPSFTHFGEIFFADLKKEASLRCLESFLEDSLPSFWQKEAEIFLLGEKSSYEFLASSHLASHTEKKSLFKVVHQAKETRSFQINREVLEGKSKSDFCGRVLIEKGADQSQAELKHHALLLSLDAKASAKPFLDIFTDDVEARHGVTLSKISEEDIFYLQSKGLKEFVAKKLLIQGFLKEMVDLT